MSLVMRNTLLLKKKPRKENWLNKIKRTVNRGYSYKYNDITRDQRHMKHVFHLLCIWLCSYQEEGIPLTGLTTPHFLFLSQARTLIFIVIYAVVFFVCVQCVKVRGPRSCSFC